MIAVAAAAVVFVVCGTWWLVSPSGAGSSDTTSPARPPGDAVTMRVHNAEKPCRKLHTLECSLRVAKNPYVLYAQPDNSVGRVWHGDEVRTTCVVTDGEMVTDEAGLSSRRWYRVEKARDGGNAGFVGWLPASVRATPPRSPSAPGRTSPHVRGVDGRPGTRAAVRCRDARPVRSDHSSPHQPRGRPGTPPTSRGSTATPSGHRRETGRPYTHGSGLPYDTAE